MRLDLQITILNKINTCNYDPFTNKTKWDFDLSITYENLHLLAPLRRPSLEFSNAAFVINLKAEVKAPDAAKPARKDWKRFNKKKDLCHFEWLKSTH